MKKIIGLIWILVLLLPAIASAATYYVSTTGSDTSSGTQTAPWKTIQKAANTMVAGDAVIVQAGDYSSERVSVTKSGSSGAPITYQAQGTVVMQGFRIIANYITVKGFEISNQLQTWQDSIGILVKGSNNQILDNYLHDLIGEGAIYVYGGGTTRDTPTTNNNLVKGNRIDHAKTAGIYVEGINSVIESNEISHIIQNPPNTSITSTNDADGIRFFGSGHVIRKNNIHDITLDDPGNDNPHIDCFQTWGPATNIIFEQNFCTNMNDNMQGWMIENAYGGQVANLTIRNNVIRAFRIANVWSAPNTEIFQNTFRSELNYTGASGYGIEFHDSPNSKLQNNIFYNVGRHQYAYYGIAGISSGISVKNNLIYMSDNRNPAGSPTSGDLWQVNPNFADQAANDYRLNSNSPAIDSGITISSVTNDYAGNSRPQGAGYDIGAYEYTSGSPPQCAGACKLNPCSSYTSCTPLTGACTSGYCCSGACTIPPPNCTEADWTHTDGACQPNNTLIRTWTKINSNCQGGVSHPASEIVSCTYVPPNIPGNLDGDNDVDLQDLIILIGDFGKTSGFNNPKSDTNSDGIVDIFDVVYVASRFT
jgi:hypothetical protein